MHSADRAQSRSSTRPCLGLVLLSMFGAVHASDKWQQTRWIHEASGTFSTVTGGGKELLITSTQHRYSLVLPFRSSGLSTGWSQDEPLRIRTDYYAVSLKFVSRSEQSAEEYLGTLLEGLRADPGLLVQQGALIGGGDRPILRVMMRYRTAPEGSAVDNDWRWYYVTAVPHEEWWYVLRVSAGERAKPNREPRDAPIRRMMREGFNVGAQATAGDAPGESGPPLDVDDRAGSSADPGDSDEAPTKGNPECQTPEWQMEPGITPPRKLSGPTPSKPAGAPRGIWAIVALMVDSAGGVRDSMVCTTNNQLWARELARRARNWRYLPAIRDGKPVEFKLILKVAID